MGCEKFKFPDKPKVKEFQTINKTPVIARRIEITIRFILSLKKISKIVRNNI